ncbi:type II secretion system F family protein [Agrobacterium vitis]|uniref:Type II secretion system protein GspF domain-containing protein n=1 Tax=Agrobacterium vitis TaxID=373 RepID=A0A7K1RN70_AGRVI|nr:type II secretion system F family protein [Agrobacterium vitis]MVA59467.1 hypothetical protein [Agrobacterium vitis]
MVNHIADRFTMTGSRFRYVSITSEGREERGYIDAVDRADAARLLSTKGLQPYLLEPAGDAEKAHSGPRRGASARAMDVERLFASIHLLLGAGLTVNAAFKLAAETEPKNRYRAIYAEIYNAVASGQNLSKALSERLDVDLTVTALLMAGEASGRMHETVGAISTMYADLRLQRSEFQSALVYPALLLTVLIGALLVITFTLVPALQPLFEGTGTTPPVLLALLADVHRMLTDSPVLSLLTLFSSLASCGCLLMTAGGRAWIKSVGLKSPGLGPVLLSIARSRYMQTLSLLLENKVNMDLSLNLAAQVVTHPALRTALIQVRDDVLTGQSLSKAIASSGTLDRISVSFVQAGEEANRLPKALADAARAVDAVTKQKIDRFMTLLSPAITIFMGLTIGTLVVSIMDSLLSINDLALQ